MKALEFTLPSGHVFLLNNLVSFIFFFLFLYWISRVINEKKFDKAIHAGISAVLTFALLNVCFWVHIGWWCAPVAVLLIGILKECYDKLFKKTHLFDPMDLQADIIGIAAVTGIYVFSFLL